MHWRLAAQIAAGLLTALSVVPYVRGVLAGEVRPQRTSWFTFSALSTVGAASQLTEGATSGAMLSLGSCVGFSVVFWLSIRHGVGGRSVADVAALVVVLVGLAGWAITSSPMVGVCAVIAAEIPAILLTARKAFHAPQSEALSTWAIDCLAGAVALSSAPTVSVAAMLYPTHHLLANALVVMEIRRGRSTGLNPG